MANEIKIKGLEATGSHLNLNLQHCTERARVFCGRDGLATTILTSTGRSVTCPPGDIRFKESAEFVSAGMKAALALSDGNGLFRDRTTLGRPAVDLSPFRITSHFKYKVCPPISRIAW